MCRRSGGLQFVAMAAEIRGPWSHRRGRLQPAGAGRFGQGAQTNTHSLGLQVGSLGAYRLRVYCLELLISDPVRSPPAVGREKLRSDFGCL